MPGTWRGVFSGVLQQRGERTHLLSALRGCSRSGERARRRRGELGSAVFARGKPFFVGGVGEPPSVTMPGMTGGVTLDAFGSTPGLYDCVVLEEPSGWTTGKASGLEERVGDAGNGDGLGVLASGDSGM